MMSVEGRYRIFLIQKLIYIENNFYSEIFISLQIPPPSIAPGYKGCSTESSERHLYSQANSMSSTERKTGRGKNTAGRNPLLSSVYF